MTGDLVRWRDAGGDAGRLELYAAVGDVAVFTDEDSRCLAAIHPSLPDVGAIGDWVGGDGVREDAEAWLKARGCRIARGPMELCTWFPHRANIGPYGDAPFAFEPTHRAEQWERNGYEVVANYSSAVVGHGPMIDSAGDRAAVLSARGWTLETLPVGPDGTLTEAVFREFIGDLHRVFDAAFRDSYGYAPVPEAVVQDWYAPYRTTLDLSLTYMARVPDGVLAGFSFSMPDSVETERGWFIVKTLAVHPDYRADGPGAWLVAASHRAAKRAGCTAGLHALKWMEGQSDSLGSHQRDARVVRRYVLLEKVL